MGGLAGDSRLLIAESLATFSEGENPAPRRRAVSGRNLAEAWKLSGTGIRQNLTLGEWLTGEIPVVEYPAAPERAPVKIDWSYPREAGLRVALRPRRGTDVEPQVFFLGLKKLRGRWVVDYFAPYEQTVVPAQG